MRLISASNRFFLYCFFCCFLGLGLFGVSFSMMEENTLSDSKTDYETHTTAIVVTGEYDPRTDPYNYNKLPSEYKREVKEEARSLRLQDDTTDRLTLELRMKQEEIRLYMVVVLAVMSLATLGIVLNCMKNSNVCRARDMLNGTGLIIVVFATVMVIIIADVDAQLTAAMGVLGGIAGYLFGTFRSTHSTEGEISEVKPG